MDSTGSQFPFLRLRITSLLKTELLKGKLTPGIGRFARIFKGPFSLRIPGDALELPKESTTV